MTFHFPIKLNRGSNSAEVTALSVNQLPASGLNCDCAFILSDQVANQVPGLYLHDGLSWRLALNKVQLDSCVIFGRGIELYYRLTEDIEITVPALIYRNTLPVQGTVMNDGSTAVFAVVLLPTEYDPSGLAPLFSPAFEGTPTAPTAVIGTNNTQLATTAFVTSALAALPQGGVASFNNRTGAVSLVLSDVTGAGGAPLFSPAFTGVPTAPTPATGDISGKLATTAFVEAALSALPEGGVASFNTRKGEVVLQLSDVTDVGAAPIASPTFTGSPKAPTPDTSDNSTNLATTAFVRAAVTGAGVSSFNTRTGAVTLTLADITNVGGAPTVSPAFSGLPTAPTQAADDDSTKLATTAFVQAGRVLSTLKDVVLTDPLDGQVLSYQEGVWINVNGGGGPGAGVASFNTRTGAVTLSQEDVVAALGYTPPQTALEDAPADGKLYGRRDALWSEINVPQTALGPLQSVQGLDTVSVIQDDGTGTGIAVLRAFKSSPTVAVVEENGLVSFESASSVVSVAGILPVDGDVPLTANDIDALPTTGGVMSGGIDMGGSPLTGLADPVNGSDAVTLNSLSLTTFDPGEY